MSTSALLSLGIRSMFANQAALQTVGQNIANANTPGYSRQSVVLTTADGQFTGAGFFGKGVSIQTVERAHNDFLTREAATSKAQATMDSTFYAQLQQLEKVFRPGELGLGQATNKFLNAMVDVASRPNDPAARQVVLGHAQELAVQFEQAGQQLADLQSGVASDLRANVDVVNQLAKQIGEANDRIAKFTGVGHEPNDLLDQRDQLISELSQYVQVSTVKNSSDGTLAVFIGGGEPLVLGSRYQQLKVVADPYDSTRVELGIVEGDSAPRMLDTNSLTGGSMTALLRFQNRDLQDGRNLVGQMAAAFAARINKQQSLGLDLADPPGRGGAIFSVGGPVVLPSSRNQRLDDGSLVSQLQVDVKDASLLRASAFLVMADPSGDPNQYLITERPDGTPRSMSADAIESAYGFRLKALPEGDALAQGDSFLVEPVAQAALNMKRVLDNPNGIAAASPVTATTNANNKGTATVQSIGLVNDSFNPAKQPLMVKFGTVDPADKSITYQITLADGTELPPTKWRAGDPIGNLPPGINLGFEMKLNGVPREGDVITVDKTTFTASNNGNAKVFLDIQKEDIVGRRLRDGGGISPGATITDAYAALMANVGARVQGASYLADVSLQVASHADAARSAESGVNLDEEAARLMQFQQSYQAAAKMLQAGQAIFDELLRLAAR